MRAALEHRPERWVPAFGKRRRENKKPAHRPGSGFRDDALARVCLPVALALLLSGAAQAQDYGGFRGRSGGEPGAFDFYVLALSWSPRYCAGEGGRREAGGQCAPGRGLGFVVHGLWPQYERGYPSHCGPSPRPLTGEALAAAGEILPSQGLARHEWRKHGTCSGLAPSAYFKAAKTARAGVNIPDAYARPEAERREKPIEIARAFAEANRGLRPDMMAVTCRRGRLEEVRICFDKALKGFSTCPGVARQGCRAGEIAIEAAR